MRQRVVTASAYFSQVAAPPRVRSVRADAAESSVRRGEEGAGGASRRWTRGEARVVRAAAGEPGEERSEDEMDVSCDGT